MPSAGHAVLGNGPAGPEKLPWTTAVINEAMRQSYEHLRGLGLR